MNNEKHFVKSNNRTYQWVDVEELKKNETIEELERDAHRADAGMVVAVLAFMVFISSVVSAGLFAGIIRTVVLKASPAVDITWLDGELQFLLLVAVIWLIVNHLLVLTVYSRAARIIANN
jgi:hypothetical protein